MAFKWGLVFLSVVAVVKTQEGYLRENPSNQLNYSPEFPTNELGTSSGEEIPGDADKDYPILAEVPDTKFSCEEYQFPGYYADPEARCQVVHICQRGGRRDSFLCPNGTIFNQEKVICDWWYNFDCSRAEEYYSINEVIVRAMEEAGRRLADVKVADGYRYNERSSVQGHHEIESFDEPTVKGVRPSYASETSSLRLSNPTIGDRSTPNGLTAGRLLFSPNEGHGLIGKQPVETQGFGTGSASRLTSEVQNSQFARFDSPHDRTLTKQGLSAALENLAPSQEYLPANNDYATVRGSSSDNVDRSRFDQVQQSVPIRLETLETTRNSYSGYGKSAPLRGSTSNTVQNPQFSNGHQGYSARLGVAVPSQTYLPGLGESAGVRGPGTKEVHSSQLGQNRQGVTNRFETLESTHKSGALRQFNSGGFERPQISQGQQGYSARIEALEPARTYLPANSKSAALRGSTTTNIYSSQHSRGQQNIPSRLETLDVERVQPSQGQQGYPARLEDLEPSRTYLPGNGKSAALRGSTTENIYGSQHSRGQQNIPSRLETLDVERVQPSQGQQGYPARLEDLEPSRTYLPGNSKSAALRGSTTQNIYGSQSNRGQQDIPSRLETLDVERVQPSQGQQGYPARLEDLEPSRTYLPGNSKSAALRGSTIENSYGSQSNRGQQNNPSRLETLDVERVQPNQGQQGYPARLENLEPSRTYLPTNSKPAALRGSTTENIYGSQSNRGQQNIPSRLETLDVERVQPSQGQQGYPARLENLEPSRTYLPTNSKPAALRGSTTENIYGSQSNRGQQNIPSRLETLDVERVQPSQGQQGYPARLEDQEPSRTYLPVGSKSEVFRGPATENLNQQQYAPLQNGPTAASFGAHEPHRTYLPGQY